MVERNGRRSQRGDGGGAKGVTEEADAACVELQRRKRLRRR